MANSIILSSPEQHKIEGQAGELVRQANVMIVASVKDEETAYETLQTIKKAIKTVEDKRKEITGPINKSLKAANELFKKLRLPFEEADRVLRGKVLDFRHAEEERAEKERERREKIQAAHEAKGHKTHEIEAPAPDVASETVTVKRWTWDLVDIKKVPEEYFVLDNAAITAAVRNGAREIPGIKIYQTEGLRV